MPETLPDAQLIIYGITGDLARRKLLPALYGLFALQAVPEHFRLIGITRRGISKKQIAENLQADLTASGTAADTAVIKQLLSSLDIVTMDITDAAAYQELQSVLDGQEQQFNTCFNRLFYLAIPPQMYGPIVDALAASKLHQGCTHSPTKAARLLIEKPFGYDFDSANELIERLDAAFDESAIYRVDHYLAKETAQNILTFRFSNPIFQALWSAEYIDRIEVRAYEQIDIEGRSIFYEQTGSW